MEDWENKTVKEVVTLIHDENLFVLPVIQRRFVWDDEKMELLFNSLFKGYSFGAIIGLEEDKHAEPLFAFRKFSNDGTPQNSEEVQQLQHKQFFVIDGQQRLQTFYIGIYGTWEGKNLYFDLFSDFESNEYEFKFLKPGKEKSFVPSENFWYSVAKLYVFLSETNDSGKVADKINAEFDIKDTEKIKLTRRVERNIQHFYQRIFNDKTIGISKVKFDTSKDVTENRQWMVELFRRLNSEGMRLSTLDLVASKLKGFDYRMENFLDDIVEENKDINLDGDKIVKILLTLTGRPLKDIANLSGDESNFAIKNSDRIKQTLQALRIFLQKSGDYNWFASNKNRSPISLYLLAYHIFYFSERNSIHPLDVVEKSAENFSNMKKWLKLSWLNGIWRRGCGWTPSEKGIKELHKELEKFQGKVFPAEELFNVCIKNLHKFYSTVKEKNLDDFDPDQEYMLYLMYDGNLSSRRVADHIQPKAKLKEMGKFTIEEINSIANLERLSSSDNSKKNDKTLNKWLPQVENQQEYLSLHLIPEDSNTWIISNFKKFLTERKKLIAAKINQAL
ncbi:MAG: DUF262 domain-containing protein [Selenomonadaceae bacterium]|nr:DUF262 domain-containing protein [Selenomonadaceae bacterium]